ncbi:Gfo/Idh/MocA family protein [Nonomuraea soli]|uniref:Myo-inositol 2-dehydrogenase/D-chiro-inositol 1-dehydrogenase n=1 Tax=Nonomuraea soli TaxID=1032476 RepID=A0A7W0HQU5_9ACTN|nr:Gfo/Idh/MocA family oxidoreductase [Nonomuraea soli]MBA2892329.1 myo-inositol 2-dehydrogenase/D-chiro-inositol 1-dehydrogenase [Nonomuraea soli]
MHATVGLIGAGGIANAHLPAWLDLGYDVAVYSTADDADALIGRHGGGRAVHSLDELFDAADVVDICTPTHTHYELALAALGHALPTVCEKPLTRTLDEAEDLVARFAAAGVPLFPAHVVRYFPEYVELRRAVARGDIGRVAVQRHTRQGRSPRNGWYLDEPLSGGVLLDLMIHDIDIARWVGGEVARVFARTNVVDGSQSTQAFLTHLGGSISVLTATWTTAPIDFRTSFEVAGSDGLLHGDSDERRPFRYQGKAEPEADILPDFSPLTSPYRAELGDFLDSIASGLAPRVTARDGLEAMRIADAVARSAVSGLPIDLELTS